MWPWGHAAVGYLLYAALTRGRRDWRRDGLAVVMLAIGTQLPDLIDKPLAWSVPLLPTGRSLAHSLLTAALVLGLGWIALRRAKHQRYLLVLGLGWVSHSFADAVTIPFSGDVAYANFLLWPILTTPPYETGKSFAAHVTQIELTPFFLIQAGLTALAVGVWRRNDYPGLEWLRAQLPTDRPKST